MSNLISILNSIIQREHMGWCDALVNKNVQGMHQTAAWINCCLEIAEKLNLEVERPLEWHSTESPMNEGQGSEVARLKKQIQEEYEAAQQGLQGLAQGIAQHTFITAHINRIGKLTDALKQLVGDDEAGRMVNEIMAAEQDPKGDQP